MVYTMRKRIGDLTNNDIGKAFTDELPAVQHRRFQKSGSDPKTLAAGER